MNNHTTRIIESMCTAIVLCFLIHGCTEVVKSENKSNICAPTQSCVQ